MQADKRTMIQHLKAKNHKGINEVQLLNLDKINVVCGKNNSGKTSIMEALNAHNTYAIGRTVDDTEELDNIFMPYSKRYTTPSPQISQQWFRNYVGDLYYRKEIWFKDEVDKIDDEYRESQKKDQHLCNYSQLFSGKDIVDGYFRKALHLHKPILIPPKRVLELDPIMDSRQEPKPNGDGIVNRLFFLKNQSKASKEYEIYKAIQKAFVEITGYTFDINVDAEQRVGVFFKSDKGRWVKSDASGLGLSDVLIILTVIIDSDYSFIMIEEPENHLHPDMQRKLLYFFRTGLNNIQFLLSTHSNIFLNNLLIDRVFFTTYTDEVKINDATSRASVLDDLGYSVADNLVSDIVILTEGPKDAPALEEFFMKMGLPAQYDIKIWPLGGDIMDQVDLSVFAQNYNIIGLVDQDPGSKRIRHRFIENCKQAGIEIFRLKRYALENYFTIEALRKVFVNQIPDIDEIEPNKKLEEQIDMNVKKRNRQIARAMKLDDIKGTDLDKFLLRVKKKCEEGRGLIKQKT